MVEADERLDDDEAALGQAGTVGRHRHRRLERRGVVVREVADDGRVERLRLLERDDARAPADERVAPEPPALDRLEQEAASALAAQPEVRPERGDEVGGYRLERCHARVFLSKPARSVMRASLPDPVRPQDPRSRRRGLCGARRRSRRLQGSSRCRIRVSGSCICGRDSGASRARTGDLLGAIQALSQLSYSPEGGPIVAAARDASTAARAGSRRPGARSAGVSPGALQKRASSPCGTTRGVSCACGIAAPPMRIPRTSSQSAAVTRAQNGYGRCSRRARPAAGDGVGARRVRRRDRIGERGARARAEVRVDERELGADRLPRHAVRFSLKALQPSSRVGAGCPHLRSTMRNRGHMSRSGIWLRAPGADTTVGDIDEGSETCTDEQSSSPCVTAFASRARRRSRERVRGPTA